MARGFTNPRTGLATVRNQSDRVPGSKIQALAIHSTESHPRPGNGDIDAIQNWFDNPASQASSHYVIDDAGRSRQLVLEQRKAWTIGLANSWTVNYELIGFAAGVWKHRAQLKKLAQHLAYSSREHGVPLRKGRVGNVGGRCVCTKTGVIFHSDVTAAGFGSHTDPGKRFPLAAVLASARWYRRRGWNPGRP